MPAVPGFTVIGELGRGADTVVYRVRRGGADWAMKVRLGAGVANERELTAFRREAALLALANHAALPNVHEVGLADGRPYLVMDYIAGQQLAQTLRRGPLPDRAVRRVALDVAQALAATHRVGLIHRDVKPHNIMMQADGSARLIDFGLVAMRTEHPVDNVVGTLTYAAPEQSGTLNRVVDARSDLYALGVVLFECATGVLPFVSGDVGELLRMHATVPAPDVRTLRPELAAGLAAIIATLLAKDPDDRYQGGGWLVADLQRLAADPQGELAPHRGFLSRVPNRIDLTGRDGELARLLSQWRAARSGHGGLALVLGGEGSGRSRLLSELSGRVEADGFPVLYAPADDRAPLAPLRRAVEEHIAGIGRMEPSRREAALGHLRHAAATAPGYLTRLSPALIQFLPGGGDPDPGASADEDGLIPALATFVLQLARNSDGALLCVDDADILDGATQRVLARLAGDAGGAALLIVASADSDFVKKLGDRGFQAEAVGSTITLGPLDDLAVARLIRVFAAGLDLDDELVRRLAMRGGRTALEVLEYLAAVIDAGLLSPVWGSWELDVDGLDGLALPADVLGLLTRRVEGMGRTALNLLAVAAVIGQQFDAPMAAVTAGINDELASDLLERAVIRGVVMHRAGEYAFTHERVRSALLERMDPQRVKDLHQDVARELDTGEAAHRYAAARHYLHGNPDLDAGRAVRAWGDAAGQALAQHAGEQAVEFLERAMDLCARTPGAATVPDVAALRNLLADAYTMTGRLSDTVTTLAQALCLASDPVERAHVLLRMSRIQKGAWDMQGSLRTAIQGLSELGEAPPANRALLFLTATATFVVGKTVEVTGVGFGSATGKQRLRFDVLTALSQTAEESALRGGRPFLSILLASRALYPAARMGTSLAYVRYRVGRSLVAKILGWPGAGLSLARAERAAAVLGTPEALAFVGYGREVGRSLGREGDERTTLTLLTELGRFLPISEYLDTVGGACFSLLGRGHVREARVWYERATARLSAADRPDHNVELIGLASATGLGRVAEGDARSRRVTDNPDAFAGPGIRVNALAMTAIAALEERDLGERFERIAADALQLNPRRLLAPQRILFATVAYGMLERCRVVPTQDRAAALAEARRAVRVLRRVPAEPIVTAHTLVIVADLRLVCGDVQGAFAALAPAEVFLARNDVPHASFEAARVRARACAQTGRAAEAVAHALFAISLAEQYGWPHRAGWIRTEFDTAARSRSGMDPATGNRSSFSATTSSSTYGRRLLALEQLSLAASRIVDPVQLTRVALDQIIQIFAADRAFLFLTDGEDSGLAPYLGRGAAGNDLAVLTEYGSTLVQRVHTDRKPLVVTGTDEGAALGSQSAVLYGLRSIMLAPLILDGRRIGVVYLDSRVAKGMFTPADVGTLTAITTYVAAALETARAAQLGFAVRAAEQQLRVAETMRDAMTDFTATLDPGEVLRRVHATITRVLTADASHLLVHDADRLTPLPAPLGVSAPVPRAAILPGAIPSAAILPVATLPPATLPVAPGGPLRRLLSTGYPVAGPAGSGARVLGLDAAGERLLGLDTAGLGCWLAVPLRSRETVVGLLVLTTTRTEVYGQAEVELAAALAAQGMIAHENARLFAEVHHLAVTDGLTGVYNRRHFLLRAGAVLKDAARRGAAVSVVMLDIDNFKRVNDEHGHPVGDQVIEAVADRLTQITREGDLLARYGGEEFVLLLPHSPEQAIQIAERIRTAVGEAPIKTNAGPVRVTVSVGIAHGVAHGTGVDADPDPLLDRADQALYAAKQGGRNRVAVYSEKP